MLQWWRFSVCNVIKCNLSWKYDLVNGLFSIELVSVYTDTDTISVLQSERCTLTLIELPKSSCECMSLSGCEQINIA